MLICCGMCTIEIKDTRDMVSFPLLFWKPKTSLKQTKNKFQIFRTKAITQYYNNCLACVCVSEFKLLRVKIKAHFNRTNKALH